VRARPGPERAGAEDPSDPGALVEVLRTAGCVFAEEEAAVLREAAHDAGHLEAMLRRRVAGEPLEHVVGFVEFMGMRLSAGPGVFIPRQRTRLLAEAAIAAVREAAHDAGRRAVFLEAFAGVGPVAAAVRRAVPEAEVHAAEREDRPLRCARENLAEVSGPAKMRRSPEIPGSAGVPGSVELPGTAGVHQASVLEDLPEELRGRLDVIAAVPPYIPRSAAGLLPREAREFEPAEALFGGEDGLAPARALMDQARSWLSGRGRVLLEMNREQCPAAARHAAGLGYVAGRIEGEDGQTAVLSLRRLDTGERRAG
jgi:release factor glutamine methyltransferase